MKIKLFLSFLFIGCVEMSTAEQDADNAVNMRKYGYDTF